MKKKILTLLLTTALIMTVSCADNRDDPENIAHYEGLNPGAPVEKSDENTVDLDTADLVPQTEIPFFETVEAETEAETRDEPQTTGDDEIQTEIPVDTELAPEIVTEPVTEKVTEPITEKVTEPVTEKVTEPITEKVTEPVTEKVTEPVTEKVTEPVTEKVTEPVTEKVTEPIETEKEPFDLEKKLNAPHEIDGNVWIEGNFKSGVQFIYRLSGDVNIIIDASELDLSKNPELIIVDQQAVWAAAVSTIDDCIASAEVRYPISDANHTIAFRFDDSLKNYGSMLICITSGEVNEDGSTDGCAIFYDFSDIDINS